MPFRPDRPYDDLPMLPPSGEIETKAVLKACVEARAALAEARMAGALIPNQSILINSIPLLEAQASSEIENIVTTSDRLFRHASLAGGTADPATKEALRYRTALNAGFRMLADRPLGTAVAVEVCRIIKGVDIDIRVTPGTALRNEAAGTTIYTPPQGERLLRDLLANWERFIHEAEHLDPLVRMAIAHYQFEAIHPFIDGNGRTGRVLNLLLLVETGLLDIPVLYLSRAIIARRQDYYRLLLAVTTEGAWEDWIVFMLEAVRTTADWTVAKIGALRRLMQEAGDTLREKAPKLYSRELLELIFVQAYCRISDVVAAGLAQRQSASLHLRKLVEIGLLQETKVGREKLYLNVALLDELTGP